MASSSSMNELTGQGNLLQASRLEGLPIGDDDTLLAGDFRLDLRTRHATVRGQQLRLTEEEFELLVLVFLVRHRKSVITPHTRVSTSSGSKQARQKDLLRVLGQLREKLAGVEGCSHYIRTEPWVACQFDPHNRDNPY
jgi:DNA-binding response OmpR family regulator